MMKDAAETSWLGELLGTCLLFIVLLKKAIPRDSVFVSRLLNQRIKVVQRMTERMQDTSRRELWSWSDGRSCVTI